MAKYRISLLIQEFMLWFFMGKSYMLGDLPA